uniref:Serine/threonine-protein kinase NAK n=1 Tax=Rhizophora mucronata TaxID=61149 RepID=A0A2P2PA22_RHIMU
MDSRLKERYPSKPAFRIAQLALNCLELEPKHRPPMKKVVETLERMEATNERKLETRIRASRPTTQRHGQQPSLQYRSPLRPKQDEGRVHQLLPRLT